MTRIFVSGIKESSKDQILDLVLTGSKKILPNFSFIDMKHIIKDAVPKKRGEIKKTKSFDDFPMEDMIKIKDSINKEISIVLSKTAKKHVIVSGYFTLRTKAGYAPLFTEDVMKKFKPDVIINLELNIHPHDIQKHPENLRLLRHQHANRMIAFSHSTATGCIVKTIMVQQNNIKQAIKDLTSSIEFFTGI